MAVKKRVDLLKPIDGGDVVVRDPKTGVIEKPVFSSPELKETASQAGKEALKGDVTPVATVRKRSGRSRSNIDQTRQALKDIDEASKGSEPVKAEPVKVEVSKAEAVSSKPTIEDFRSVVVQRESSLPLSARNVERERQEDDLIARNLVLKPGVVLPDKPKTIGEAARRKVEALGLKKLRSGSDNLAYTAASFEQAGYFIASATFRAREAAVNLGKEFLSSPVESLGGTFIALTTPEQTLRGLGGRVRQGETPELLGEFAVGYAAGGVGGVLGRGVTAGRTALFNRRIRLMDEPKLFNPDFSSVEFIDVAKKPSVVVELPSARAGNSVQQLKLKVESPAREIVGKLVDGEVRFFEPIKIIEKPSPTKPIVRPVELQQTIPKSGVDLLVKDVGREFIFVSDKGSFLSLKGKRGQASLVSPLFDEVVSVFDKLDVGVKRFSSDFEGLSSVRSVKPVPFLSGVNGGVVGQSLFGLKDLRVVNPLRSVDVVRQVSKPSTIESSLGKVKSLVGQDLRFGSSSRQGSRSSQVQDLFIGQVSGQVQAQAQVQSQAQAQSQAQVSQVSPFLKSKTVVLSKVKDFKRDLVVSKPSALFSKVFDVFVRRKGKDVFIGSESGLKEASGSLFGKLRGSLAASGFVRERKSGKFLGLEELGGSPLEFVKGKREPFRIVQKRGKRLSSRSEVFEIQKAKAKGLFFGGSKKKKGRKVKFI